MKRKYPIYKKWAYGALWTTDTLLSLFSRPSFHPIPPPKRLLLANCARMGDVLLTSSLLPCLKETYPNIEIGMLVNSSAKCVIESHPYVNWVHTFDHWKITKGNYLNSRKHACKEIRALNYDTAVDCCFHFPNAAPLLWQAKIPTRIGFASAGFGPLLTHTHPFNPKENRSAIDTYRTLLPALKGKPRPMLIHNSTSNHSESIVIHLGASNAQKQWPLQKWRALTERLVNANHQLLFTGKGALEAKQIAIVTKDLPVTNLCDQLDWKEFVATIQKARLVIGVDSLAGHVAGAVGTDAILLYTGINPRRIWCPVGKNIIRLYGHVECSPCLKGCKAMTCMDEISVDRVWNVVVTSVFATAKASHTLPVVPTDGSVFLVP